MKNLFYIFSIVSLGLLFNMADAQTLHVIGFFDTNDESIGVNKAAEQKRTINEMETIASFLEESGYDSNFRICFGNECNKKNLMAVVNGLEISSNDIVFFYYGGHGARAFNNESDPFPQMCLGEDYQNNWVPATLIKNTIVKKNPRLAIVLTGCCNKEGRGVTIKRVYAEDRGYTSEANINKDAYKKLFSEAKGVVMMTSSKAGQYSYSGKEGGVFCNTFWDIMIEVGTGETPADWRQICEKVKKEVSSVQIVTDAGTVTQTPYYEVSLGSSASPTVPTNTTNTTKTPTRTTVVNNTPTTLSNDLMRLLDKSQNVDYRLGLVDMILNAHFTSDAKVCTVGRDMTTIVDYEDASTFLRRIAMSPFITKINVIEQNGGKNKIITVHEVRNR